MISKSSMSYRGGSSCDPSSSDVVSPDIVYGILPSQASSEKVSDLFLPGTSTRGKKKGSPGSTIHTVIFLDRVPTTTRSHILLFVTWPPRDDFVFDVIMVVKINPN